MLATHLSELAPLHTHEFPLQEVVRAIEVLAGEDPNEKPLSVSIYPPH